MKKRNTYFLQPLSVIFHHMFQMLQFLGREILFHVRSISLKSICVVLVCRAFTTVPVLFWQNESIGALPMLNPVKSSPTGFWTPPLVTTAYMSKNRCQESKGKEN